MIWEMIAYLHVFLLTGLFLDTGSVSKETWASWARGTHCHLALTHRSQPGHSSYPCVHPQLSPRCCVLGLELCYNGSTSVLAAVEDGGTAGDGTEHYSFGDSAILELSAPSGYFKRVIGKKHELFPQVTTCLIYQNVSIVTSNLHCDVGLVPIYLFLYTRNKENGETNLKQPRGVRYWLVVKEILTGCHLLLW